MVKKKKTKAKRAKKKTTVKKAKRSKKAVKAKGKSLKAKEKPIGMVEHFFGRISVAAIKLAAPLKVGDTIHIKGHTTDIIQKLDSMQIEHQNVAKAGKGDDIGIKVRAKVRPHDFVFLAPEQRSASLQPPLPMMAQPQPKASRPSGPGNYSSKKFLQF